jgi:hypothetical protein
MGLRLKLNLLVVPLVAAVTILMVWADQRHEMAAIMASHAMHTAVVGTAAAISPVDPDTLPEVVARDSLRMHLAYGVVLLVLLVTGVNGALEVLVLRPLQRARARLIKMEHGYWRASIEPTSEDEMGQLIHSFQVLGPEIDALVGQSLQAERLAVLALLSQYLRGRLEPDLERVAAVAARLNGGHEADAQEAAQELARRVASMFATVHGLDRAFFKEAPAGARR